MKLEKRQMSKSMSYTEMLSQYTVSDLKEICKAWQVKGISKLKKSELVETIESTLKRDLFLKLAEFNLDHFTIVFQLYQGKNVFNAFTDAAGQLIDLGIILEGMVDDQKQILLSNEIYKSFVDYYQEHQEELAFNTILKDYLTLSVELYGVVKKEDFINDFFAFNQGPVDETVMNQKLATIINHVAVIESDETYYYYYRLADYKKVYEDSQKKDDIKRKEITPELLQQFVQNNNRFLHPRFNELAELMSKNLKDEGYLFDQTLDEMRVMLSYNHSMSDFLQLFSQKHTITEMQILKDIADHLIVINNEWPHWELKGHSPLELAGGKNKPLVKGEKIGRNDPCPCGSGKKYKKCCLNK